MWLHSSFSWLRSWARIPLNSNPITRLWFFEWLIFCPGSKSFIELRLWFLCYSFWLETQKLRRVVDSADSSASSFKTRVLLCRLLIIWSIQIQKVCHQFLFGIFSSVHTCSQISQEQLTSRWSATLSAWIEHFFWRASDAEREPNECTQFWFWNSDHVGLKWVSSPSIPHSSSSNIS